MPASPSSHSLERRRPATWAAAWMSLATGSLALLMACKESAAPTAPPVATASSGTAVLGAATAPRASATPPTLVDDQGRPLPEPPLPRGAQAQAVRTGPDTALAVWLQDGRVMTSSYTAAQGWAPPQVLEDIHGEARDVQLASNGRGVAIALWQHTVGNIQSLRSSRYEVAAGWSVPDVMPGALPREPSMAHSPPELRMDADGNASAHWPSGFHANEMQSARYVAGLGWSHAVGEPIARAAPASGTMQQ